jgi:hypothetical protein
MKEQVPKNAVSNSTPRGLTKDPTVIVSSSQAMEFAFVTALGADDSFWRRWTTKEESICCITATN